MKFSQDLPDSGFRIQAYGAGEIRILSAGPMGGVRVFTRSLVITIGGLDEWRPQSVEVLQREDLELLVADRPEVLLLGSGPSLKFPSPALLAPLLKASIGVEVMDTPAACRTYNILAAEGRRVAAALIIP